MRCVFRCGCVGATSHPLARCKEHDQLIATFINTTPSTNPKRWLGDKTTIVLNSVADSISRLSPSSINYIVSYPNQSEFWARIETNFLNMPDLFFGEYHRVLKDDGLVILFVEQSLISAAAYVACLHNFNVNSISLVNINTELPINCYNRIGHKFCMVLSKRDNNDLTLGNFKFKEVSKFFDHFPRGVVLDPTCLMPHIVLNASRSKHRVIGFCYEFDVFKHIATELRKAE